MIGDAHGICFLKKENGESSEKRKGLLDVEPWKGNVEGRKVFVGRAH